MGFSVVSTLASSSEDACKSLFWRGLPLEDVGLVRRCGAAPGSLPLGGILEAGSEAVEEQIAAETAELLVEVVSAWFKLVAVEVVSVGFVSLEEVEGTETSSEQRTAV